MFYHHLKLYYLTTSLLFHKTMFNRKEVPTKGNEDKYPFVIHLVNKKNTDEKYKTKVYHDDPPIFRIVSIDPAVKNYCIRIEDRPRPGCTGEIVSHVYQRVDLNPGKDYKDDENYVFLYTNLNSFLEKFQEFWKSADYIIIEKQLPKNTNSVRIMAHTMAFFMCELKESPYLPLILEVDPRIKTKLLGAPSNLNERGYKTWTIEKSTQLLMQRNDHFSLLILKRSKKKDDLADTVAQCEAVAIKMGWPITEELY